MSTARDFLLIAKDGKEPTVTHDAPRITFQGQGTFWKMCAECGDQMPHVRRQDYTECVVCGCRTYAKKDGER